jgi:hypothetical protein
MTLYNRGLIETIARKAPLTGTKTVFGRNLGDFMEEYTGFREPYTPLQQAGKEADKFFGSKIRGVASSFAGAPEEKQKLFSERLFKFEGGLVPKVDPYTGIPYEIKEHKIEFYGGGLASKMSERKAYRVGLSVEKDVPDVEDDPADRSIDGTKESYKEVAGQDTEAKITEPITKVPLITPEQREDNVLPVEEKTQTKYNNPGNVEEGQGFGGETGEVYQEERRKEGMRAFVVFDSPEAGVRAIARDMTKKLKRFSGDSELAVLEYLGGGRSGTLEERYALARKDNKYADKYIQRAVEAYNTEGITGLVKRIIKEENSEELEKFYLTPSIFNKGMEIAQHDYPTGTTTEQMLNDLTSGIFRTK